MPIYTPLRFRISPSPRNPKKNRSNPHRRRTCPDRTGHRPPRRRQPTASRQVAPRVPSSPPTPGARQAHEGPSPARSLPAASSYVRRRHLRRRWPPPPRAAAPPTGVRRRVAAGRRADPAPPRCHLRWPRLRHRPAPPSRPPDAAPPAVVPAFAGVASGGAPRPRLLQCPNPRSRI